MCIYTPTIYSYLLIYSLYKFYIPSSDHSLGSRKYAPHHSSMIIIIITITIISVDILLYSITIPVIFVTIVPVVVKTITIAVA